MKVVISDGLTVAKYLTLHKSLTRKTREVSLGFKKYAKKCNNFSFQKAKMRQKNFVHPLKQAKHAAALLGDPLWLGYSCFPNKQDLWNK